MSTATCSFKLLPESTSDTRQVEVIGPIRATSSTVPGMEALEQKIDRALNQANVQVATARELLLQQRFNDAQKLLCRVLARITDHADATILKLEAEKLVERIRLCET
jgi:hypothetical protein